MIALLLAAATLAIAGDPVDAPPVGMPVAAPADDLRTAAAIIGRDMAGRPVGTRHAGADKVLLLTYDSKGEIVVRASFALPLSRTLPPPPVEVLAIVRLHQEMRSVVPGPTADDLAFVARYRTPLYVVGEWARPAPVWEVAMLGDMVRYRTVGEAGEIGPWLD